MKRNTHNFTEVQDATTQKELIELAESDTRIEKVGNHSGFVWFTVDEDVLIDFYTETDRLVNLEHTRYDSMAMGIAKPDHSALN